MLRFVPMPKNRVKGPWPERSTWPAACLALLSSLALPAQAADTACIYEHVNYVGASFCADVSSGWVGGAWNDRASSIKVRAGYKVQLFTDANYGGTSITLTADSANLVPMGFNDRTSSFRVSVADSTLPTSDNPDFGPNVSIFEPSTPIATIRARVNSAFDSQNQSPTAQFGPQRYAFLFKPGTYNDLWINLGFYTSVVGLGLNPDDVRLQSGALNVDSGWNHGDLTNATQNFWRSAENLSLVPNGGTNRWAVSQAAPMRRVHIIGNLHLGPSNQGNGQGYSSGGYLADSKVDGSISSGSQQQWYTRDSNIGVWYDGVWNMVFSGVAGGPASTFPSPPAHRARHHAVLAREALLVRGQRRALPRVRAGTAHQCLRRQLGQWPDTGLVDSDEPVLRGQARRHRGDAQPGAVAGAEPLLHAWHLLPQRHRACDASRHRGAGTGLPDAGA